ncbi:MAG: NUDIX domain-containing protein [Proteobacteria bacterium]|nr:NUDIX domain-containing protein [Pseudomonadota bacterium]MBU1717222.1 NUDIX domain-containing protein [Pseudomonadota bacterium]
MTTQEMVIIVDRFNKEIGTRSRQEMRAGNLIHRASFILVFNDGGELFVQQRTMSKDIYPGRWEIAAGGVVAAGETVSQSAARELREELGIVVELRFLLEMYFEDPSNRVFCHIFQANHNGPFILQPEEVVRGEFMKLSEITTRLEVANLTPDSLPILAYLIENEQSLGRI